MRQLNLALCSGGSSLTVGDLARLWGVNSKTARCYVTSGRLPLAAGPGPGGERAWYKLTLEEAVAFLTFRGGPGDGRPWSSRRVWESGYRDYAAWRVLTQGQGYRVSFVDGEWAYGPPGDSEPESGPPPVAGELVAAVSGAVVRGYLLTRG